MRNQPLLLTFFSFFLENSFFINKNCQTASKENLNISQRGKKWEKIEAPMKPQVNFVKVAIDRMIQKNSNQKLYHFFCQNFSKIGYFMPPSFDKFFET